jgi:hypothetical protein
MTAEVIDLTMERGRRLTGQALPGKSAAAFVPRDLIGSDAAQVQVIAVGDMVKDAWGRSGHVVVLGDDAVGKACALVQMPGFRTIVRVTSLEPIAGRL